MPLALSSLATAAPVTRVADAAAAANWRANLAALAERRPALTAQLEPRSVDVTWLYGRDGALTARDSTGAWWAGCSVPAAAARAMLKSFGGSAAVACFLRPPSAAAVRAALEKLRRNQAVVAVVPDLDAAWVLLHCEDFADDVRARRLWFAFGDDWEVRLAALLLQNEGLPTPAQFIRLNDGNEELAEAMIARAQRVFSDVAQQRVEAIAQLQARAADLGATYRACVIAPTHFRLWDDAGFALAQLAAQLGWVHVDPDDPACASPLATARAAAGCAAVVMPNTGRADLPNMIAPTTQWVTWLTGPRIPASAGAGPSDVLLVADAAWRDAALAAGWPAKRVQVAAWPDAQLPAATGGPLLVLADLRPLDPPKDVAEMSSHRLLWEAVADELVRDPFALGASVLDYLHARMERLNIAPTALDQRRFIDDLIAPAYARGLAELLGRSGLPLRVAGEGWDAIEPLKSHAAGPVADRGAFLEVVASSAALVHVWLTSCAHPIDDAGRPVVRPHRGRDAFLRDARLAVTGKLASSQRRAPPLCQDILSAAISAPKHRE